MASGHGIILYDLITHSQHISVDISSRPANVPFMMKKLAENNTKNILAFETTLSGINVGFVSREINQIEEYIDTEREQAAMLIPTIQSVLEEAKREFKDLDLIVSTVGPGSFTGLRIGLCTARIMSMTLNKPLIGVTTLDMIMHQYLQNNNDPAPDHKYLILLETKRKDFYACFFDNKGEKISEPFASDASDILAKIQTDHNEFKMNIGGNCLQRFQDNIDTNGIEIKFLPVIERIDPVQMALHGAYLFDKYGESKGSLNPLYLREADVSFSTKPARKLSQV